MIQHSKPVGMKKLKSSGFSLSPDFLSTFRLCFDWCRWWWLFWRPETARRYKPKCTKQSLVALMTRDPTTGRSKEVQICQVASSPGANGIEVVMCNVNTVHQGNLEGRLKLDMDQGELIRSPNFWFWSVMVPQNLPLFTLYLCHTVTSICWWLRTSHEWKRDGGPATLESASILRSAPYWPSWPKQRPDWGGRFDMFDVWLRLLRFYLFILWKCAPPSMQVTSRYSILFAKENLHNFSLAAVHSSHEGLGEPQPRRAARQGLCWKIRWGQSCQQGACRGQSGRKSARGQGGCGQSGISGCNSWALAGEVWPGNREGGAMERPGRMDQRLGPYGGDLGLVEGWSEIFCLLIFPFADRASST